MKKFDQIYRSILNENTLISQQQQTETENQATETETQEQTQEQTANSEKQTQETDQTTQDNTQEEETTESEQGETQKEDDTKQVQDIQLMFSSDLASQFSNTVNKFTHTAAQIIKKRTVSKSQSDKIYDLMSKIKSLLDAANKTVDITQQK